MFEQAVLRPARVRGWAVTLGFTGEVLLVACVLVAPLIWPQLLPRAETTAWIFAPAPPPAAYKPAFVPRGRASRPLANPSSWLPWPTRVPTSVAALDEPPASAPDVKGGVEGVEQGNAFAQVLNSVITPPQRLAGPAAPPAVKATPAEPRRITVSHMNPAQLVHRVEPVYPPIARQTRTSGTVELTGIIGTDGHIRELRVVSGHPLLVKAAVDAVRQWVYQPTLLSGGPVDVITTISVVFRLN